MATETIERNSDVQDDDVSGAAPIGDSPASDADEFAGEPTAAVVDDVAVDGAACDGDGPGGPDDDDDYERWRHHNQPAIEREDERAFFEALQRAARRIAAGEFGERAKRNAPDPEEPRLEERFESGREAGMKMLQTLFFMGETLERWREDGGPSDNELDGMNNVVGQLADDIHDISAVFDHIKYPIGWGQQYDNQPAALVALSRGAVLAMRNLARAAGIPPDNTKELSCRVGSATAQAAMLLLAARPDAVAIVQAFWAARNNGTDLTGEWMRPFVPAGTDVLAACCGTLAPQAPAEPT